MIRKLAPTLKIVKQDPDTLEPYRDPKTGFCVEVNNGAWFESIYSPICLVILTHGLA